jgi:uncharacterized hydrophobic protein (TIGR00341 family)
MTLRLLEVRHPHLKEEVLCRTLEEVEILELWQDQVSEQESITHMVLRQEEVDLVIECLKKHFPLEGQLRVTILPVEAFLPRKDEPKPELLDEPTRHRRYSRTSVEEIYVDATNMASPTGIYVMMSILAAVVAAVGLLLDDVAIIIGSMVIAPLLGPNIAMTLAVTLADPKLTRIALGSSLLGYLLALSVGIVFGVLVEVDPAGPQLVTRTEFSLLMAIVALSAGVAGTLTFNQGAPQSLVGVMVAVALLPPLVAGGLMIGSGNLREAVGAMLLFAINVLSINLAGIAVFYLQGVAPSSWFEKERARRTTFRGFLAWCALLLVVLVLVVLYQRYA